MNPPFGLFRGIEDFCALLERVGLILVTQADTERVVKTQRKVESRFANFNEAKESEGKRDRAKQEILLHENKVKMDKLPLEELNQLWLKSHLPALKRSDGGSVAVKNFLKKDTSNDVIF